MTYIISLGGSLIVPSEIDFKFLKKFRTLILSQVKLGHKFYLITGGGQTNRDYINAVKQVTAPSDNELDWLGIYSSHLNALLVKTIFGELAFKEIIKDPTKIIKTSKPIIIGGGWKPGRSTDFVAAAMAKTYNLKNIINLSNIDYVYDKDPGQYPDARVIKEINWADFRKIVGNKWSPRLSSPFDPIAAQVCEKLKIKAVIMNGKNILNLKRYLNQEKFKGTIIK